MDPSVARALSLMSIRLAKMEAIVNKVNFEAANQEEDLPYRYAEMFADVKIDESVIKGAPMLINLYKTDSLRLTAQCVGTWPQESSASNALCLFGGCEFGSGAPCEEIRQCVIPELIKRQVPFSITQVDAGEEEPFKKISSLLQTSPSHLLIDSPGGWNFVNRVAAAYLLGRGCGMVYRIVRPSTQNNDEIPNIYGTDGSFTNSHRVAECDRLLLSMSREGKSGAVDALEFPSFLEKESGKKSFLGDVLRTMPDVLQNHNVQSVASRRGHWNEILDGEPIVTDMALVVACSYVAGMLSPRARGVYTPVPRDAIGRADDWCGRIKTLLLLGQVLSPGTNAASVRADNDARVALDFFCRILEAEN